MCCAIACLATSPAWAPIFTSVTVPVIWWLMLPTTSRRWRWPPERGCWPWWTPWSSASWCFPSCAASIPGSWPCSPCCRCLWWRFSWTVLASRSTRSSRRRRGPSPDSTTRPRRPSRVSGCSNPMRWNPWRIRDLPSWPVRRGSATWRWHVSTPNSIPSSICASAAPTSSRWRGAAPWCCRVNWPWGSSPASPCILASWSGPCLPSPGCSTS